MSNYLAISTVTVAIRQLLFQEISAEIRDIPFTVTSNPPDTLIDQPPANRINIFLYNVTRNAGYGNLFLPARSNTTGELIQRQQIGLNLYYLLTVYAANNDDLLTHRLLASAMRVLDEKPILNRQIIGDAINSVLLADDNVTATDLADQIDTVKLNFYNPSFDEIAKLWSSLFQTHYRLSLVYEATLVLLDSKQQQPKPIIPVQARQIYVAPFKQSIIEKVDPQIVEYTSNTRMTLLGQNLQSEGLGIQIDGSSIVPNIEDITDDKISFILPQNLSTGIKPIQIIYTQKLISSSFSPITAAADTALGPRIMQYKSNISAFILAPRITTASKFNVKKKGNLVFSFEPAVSAQQKISVMLDSNVFSTTPLPAATSTQVTLNIPDSLAEKTYLLRVLVGDTVSLLRVDNDAGSPNYNKLGPIVQVSP